MDLRMIMDSKVRMDLSDFNFKNVGELKVLYHTLFSGVWPSCYEFIVLLSEAGGFTKESVLGWTQKLIQNDVSIYDANLFASVFQLCDGMVNQDSLATLRRMCFSKCTGCKKWRSAACFLADNGQLSSRCDTCRRKKIVTNIPHLIYTIACLDDSENVVDEFGVIHESNIIASRTLQWPISTRVVMLDSVDFQDVYIERDSATNVRRNLEKKFLQYLHGLEGYSYRSKYLRTGSSKYICKQCITGKNPANEPTKKRARMSKRLFKCEGTVNFCYSASAVFTIEIRHQMHHECHTDTGFLSDEQQDKIKNWASEGLLPYQIRSQLISSGVKNITYDQVYYAWHNTVKIEYEKNKCPKLSALQYVSSSTNLVLLCHNDAPYFLGFTFSFAMDLCNRFSIREGFIDSTFKTNSEKMELFAVVAKVFGSSVPIAYLLHDTVKMGNQNDTSNRKHSVHSFLRSLQKKIPTFRPIFWFSDKDSTQLSAIQNIYNVVPSLCLWHLNRAVITKIKEIRKGGSVISEQSEKEVLHLMNKHYNQHPFVSPDISNCNIVEIRDKAMGEMNMYLFGKNVPDLLAYFQKNWYAIDKFKIWGRRNFVAGIPFSKTTMAVEAHWSSLKRTFLLGHNRPRCDMLIYIIDKKLLPKVEADINSMIRGVMKPNWWRRFALQWRIASNTTIHGMYSTDRSRWICSCEAFLRSEFMFCKHLTQNLKVPIYREVQRSSKPPFLSFKFVEGRPYADLNSECWEAESGVNISEELSPVNLQLQDSMDFHEDKTEDLKKDILEVLEWTTNHVCEISKLDSSEKQLHHVDGSVLAPLKRYMNLIKSSENARTAETTRANRATMFMK